MLNSRRLLTSLKEGEVIPVVGAGVSMAVKKLDGDSAFPSWWGLIEDGAARLEARGVDTTQLRSALKADPPEYLLAADQIRLGMDDAEWSQWLNANLYPKREDLLPESLELARLVWSLGRQLVITTNYDNILTQAFPGAKPPETWIGKIPLGRGRQLLKTSTSGPLLWHLHGAISDPKEIVLTSASYKRLYEGTSKESEAIQHGLKTLFSSRSMLFIGFSLDDPYIRRLMEWAEYIFPSTPGDDHTHYMMILKKDEADFKAKLKGLPIEFITFKSFGPPMVECLKSLSEQAGASATSSPKAAAPSTPPRASGRWNSRPRLLPLGSALITAIALLLTLFLVIRWLITPDISPIKIHWAYVSAAQYPLDPKANKDKVDVPAFCLSKYEVSVSEYRQCVEAGACESSPLERDNGCNGREGRENHPINCVTWDEAQVFAKWSKARLPLEIEWALAARGPELRAYPWGEGHTPSCLRACYDRQDRIFTTGCNTGSTCNIGVRPLGATPGTGIQDLAGNVGEWTASGWTMGLLSAPNQGASFMHNDSETKVIRGFGWNQGLNSWTAPGSKNRAEHDVNLGFRLAKAPLSEGRCEVENPMVNTPQP